MNQFTNILIALSFAVGLAACGGGNSGYIIPVESELKPWVAPETDDIIEVEDADDDEDYEDYEDEEDAPAAPAPPAAPSN